jgi:Na+-translocating ferredoxin:NAD+ oxidoreductase subunit D
MQIMTVSEAQKTVQLGLVTSPHLHSRWTTQRVMWTVVIALLPCVGAGVYYFGFEQLTVIAVAVIFANGADAGAMVLRKRNITLTDGSATLTGLLLALTLPPNFSLSATAIGAVIAIGLGKQVFGGLGHNIFNPALVGRAFLQAAFPVAMTTWVEPRFAVDAITSATPLAAFKFESFRLALLPMLLGNTGGTIGETSAVAVLIGGSVLILLGIVNWRIPTAILAATTISGTLLWFFYPALFLSPLYQIFGGGLLFGAFFMATDWVTSPETNRGMWIFGLGIAFIVIFIRGFGGLPEGVMYSILLMNALVPVINRYTRPRPFGAPA